MNPPRILIVEDDIDHGRSLAEAIGDLDCQVELAATGTAGVAAFRARGADVVLSDLVLPDMDGIEVMKQIRALDDGGTPVIVMTAYGSIDSSVRAMKEGAYDYLQKPLDVGDLQAKLFRALEASRLRRQVAVLSEEVRGKWTARAWVAESPAMREVVRQTLALAKTNATVLIRGESGTGKELVARALHADGPRAAGPFVAVNCAAFTESLLESELFGHEKGAFTGADASHRGRFEEAHEGSIFLDEIGELPLSVQPTLLHVLESGAMRRVGGSRELTVDVRVIAATNRSLEDDVREGRFREDLFYRLNVFALEVPPMRERRDDILPLAAHFLKDGKRRLAPATERVLMAYDWPGNVRELRNAMERAGIMADGNLVLPKDLPPQLQDAAPAAKSGSVLVGDMREIQRRAILEAIEKTGGNKTRAADLLGISRRNLIYKLREYGL